MNSTDSYGRRRNKKMTGSPRSPRRRASKLQTRMIIGMIIIASISILNIFRTLSDVSDHEESNLSLDNNLYISKSGQLSTIPEDKSRLEIFETREYKAIRQKAIEAAKKQTKQLMREERRMQRLRDAEKEEYLEKLAEEEALNLKKKEEREREEEEMKYYMYYEDNHDEKSTVIGMTYKSDPKIFKRFVGSLRGVGYGGNIIIGVEDVSEETMSYLNEHNVIVKELKPTECTFDTAKDRQKCYMPYPHIKREWAHFPLTRDWLSACEICSGPVVFAAVENTFFQKNPFGANMPVVKRLHIYEQHPSVDAAKTNAGLLMKACVDIDLAEKMEGDDPEVGPTRGILSTGTALGTRDDLIDYLGLAYSVIREWMQKPECHFQHSSGDAGDAVVNYLRVMERLPYRTRIMIHRTGIVNNVGFEGDNALEAHVHLWTFRGKTTEEAYKVPYDEGATGDGWIDTDYLVTDEEGNFIDVFFQKSAIIYGYDSFGLPFLTWLDKQFNITSDTTAIAVESDGNANDIGQGKPEESDLSKVTADRNRTVETGNSQEKELNGYYLDESKDQLLGKNETEPERKQKIIRTSEKTAEREEGAQQEMYYPKQKVPEKDEGNEKVVNVQPVPVEETHEKKSDNKNKDNKEDSRMKLDQGGEEDDDATKQRVPLEPVDKKFEIPSENEDGENGLMTAA